MTRPLIFAAGVLCGAFGAAYALAMFLSSSREEPQVGIDEAKQVQYTIPSQQYTIPSRRYYGTQDDIIGRTETGADGVQFTWTANTIQ